jgi:hypothetical protein
MTVRIGHAYSDENIKAKGGKAGDQTSKEVLVQDWYLREKGWSCVFRAKDKTIAEKIARAVEQACANNNIGYDQSQRTTLYKYAKKYNWDLAKITEPCECDCSSLVAVCVNAAGVSVSKDMYTGNQKAVLMSTNIFDILSNTEYLTKPDLLKRGDILLGPGHTAIIVSELVSNVERAKSFSQNYAGIYTTTAAKLNVRYGAGTNKGIITIIPKGTKVRCYGYYTKIQGTYWLYIQFNHKDKQYTGYVSMKYLSK